MHVFKVFSRFFQVSLDCVPESVMAACADDEHARGLIEQLRLEKERCIQVELVLQERLVKLEYAGHGLNNRDLPPRMITVYTYGVVI